MKYSFLAILIITISCKSTEQKFKESILSEYGNQSICFRIDQSEKVGSFGVRLFEKKENESSSVDSFSSDFESGANCDLVALTGKVSDSIYVSVVYPFNEDIIQTLEEYQKWYYKGKVYYFKKSRKGTYIDTTSIQTNPPVINPRNVEDWGNMNHELIHSSNN